MSSPKTTAEPRRYESGYRGTREQLLRALRYPRGSASELATRGAAAQLIEELCDEVRRLQEYEWMYKDLCK